jgi:hypothetical protein
VTGERFAAAGVAAAGGGREARPGTALATGIGRRRDSAPARRVAIFSDVPTKRPARPDRPASNTPGRPPHSGKWCRAILGALAARPVVPLHTLDPADADRGVRVACRRAAGELERSGLCRLAWRRLPGRTTPSACAVRVGTPGAGVLETAGRRQAWRG